MRTLAVLFGLIVFAGLVIMAVAGSDAALGVLFTGGGIVAMIVLGTRVGGRGARSSGAPGDGASAAAPRSAGAPGDGEEPTGAQPR